MTHTKQALYRIEQIRLCEQMAKDDLGLSDETLMLRAATEAFRVVTTLYPDVRNLAVFCGAGNNAGDGYVLARLAHQKGFSVRIYACKPVDELPATAKQAAIAAMAAGISCESIDDWVDGEVELIIDALLGIGIKGLVRGSIEQAINLMNDSGLPILALDVPSGLDADTGCVLGVCAQAAVTVTFIALKMGLFTLDGPDHAGKIECVTLQLSSCLRTLDPSAYLLDDAALRGLLKPRKLNSHKGMYGHVLIIGGGPGMPGAVYLAALAAMRVGAGMVTIATHPEHVTGVLPLLPEVMIHAIHDIQDLLPLLARATIGVVGPGLGESVWANDVFQAVISAQLPLVIDASALRMLALHPQQDENWILTPHPGEAAGLLSCSIEDIQHDRCQSARLIQQQFGGCVVLKGAGTFVHTLEDQSYICMAGNPGMATAGMGDVLSGIIGGLLAQGLSMDDAAKLGVWVHARAADDAVLKQGERGLMASDLMPYLRRQINRFT